MENQEPGAFVVWYVVTDLDVDANGDVDGVSVDPADLFELRPEEGRVKTMRV